MHILVLCILISLKFSGDPSFKIYLDQKKKKMEKKIYLDRIKRKKE